MVVATTIGLGLKNGRTFLRQGYIVYSNGRLSKVVHTTGRCRAPRDNTNLESVSIYEEDGNIKITFRGLERTVKYCDKCPPAFNLDWHEQAACFTSGEDFFTFTPTEQQSLINTYCDQCPVALECLEDGASETEGTVGGIWGGLYFGFFRYTGRHEKLRENIESQRVRIHKRLSRRRAG